MTVSPTAQVCPPCARGSWSAAFGLRRQGDCTACAAGRGTYTAVSTDRSDCVPCRPGEYFDQSAVIGAGSSRPAAAAPVRERRVQL